MCVAIADSESLLSARVKVDESSFEPFQLLSRLLSRYDRCAMATQKFMLQELSFDERYRVADSENLLTPALAIYPENIASNIAAP